MIVKCLALVLGLSTLTALADDQFPITADKTIRVLKELDHQVKNWKPGDEVPRRLRSFPEGHVPPLSFVNSDAYEDVFTARNLIGGISLAAAGPTLPSPDYHAVIWIFVAVALALGVTLRLSRPKRYRDTSPATVRKAAEQGNAKAQTYLGWMLANGSGVPKDEAEAASWYRRAAEQGNAEAQCNLASVLCEGRGVPKDDAQALSWFLKSGEQGHAFAQYSVGCFLCDGRGAEKNEAEGVAWFRKAAKQGHTSAQFNLGWMLARGRGVAKDEIQAATWFRKAAEQGHAAAQFSLAWMLANGRAVPRDERQAERWFRKAAEQGFALPIVEGKPVDSPPSENSSYRKLRPPRYSPSREHVEKCVLKVLVCLDGSPKEIVVEKSSGYSEFDQAAVTAVKTWVFNPGIRNGLVYEGEVRVRITQSDCRGAERQANE
jgi:TonB family protein